MISASVHHVSHLETELYKKHFIFKMDISRIETGISIKLTQTKQIN